MGMRKARLLGEGDSFYHVMSRVVGGDFVFGEGEKRWFYRLMRKLEVFCGVRVVTYCLMGNHFHLLVEVPDLGELVLDEEELLRRVRVLSGGAAAAELEFQLKLYSEQGNFRAIEDTLERYRRRMGDLGMFMKALKGQFTQWYNWKHERRGTLWESRYKSVLVEDCEKALLAMGAYIDLNPVRAGMVEDPAEYRWSGYGEACAGRGVARRGLGVILESVGVTADPGKSGKKVTWRETGVKYRQLLYGVGEDLTGAESEPGQALVRSAGSRDRLGFSREAVERALAGGGRLPLEMALRCRVRYFSDGAVFGTREFVDRVFEGNRDRFGPDRKTGARKMPLGLIGGNCGCYVDCRWM